MTAESTQHASPGNGAANQAGSFSLPLKPALSRSAQLSLLQKRGLIVRDRDAALELLSQSNYYRLQGYCLPYLNGERFKPGTTFDLIHETYALDRELRHWLWRTIEPVEIKARTAFAYRLSMTFDADSYRNPALFHNRNEHAKSFANVQREIDRAYRNGVPCVKHNIDKYGDLPIWAAVEIMPFGTLSRLYGNLSTHATDGSGRSIHRAIADEFGTKPEALKSWLHHLSYVRNTCAHHNRFYNMVISTQPKLLKCDVAHTSKKEFPTFIVLMRLYEKSWAEQWPALMEELERAIAAHPTVSLRPMGFPSNWSSVLKMDANGHKP